MVNLKEIGNRIQSLRKQRGLTQEELADKMNVSIQMVSNLERGNKAIRIDNLVNLCQILDASADYILTGVGNASDLNAFTKRFSQLSCRDQKMFNNLIDFCMANKAK